MSRRSTRRGKKRSIYSLNDLVQIPHNSTNLVGRLACKIMEQPSVRWLVAFDDIPTRKDEEIAEEALGPIIGKHGTNGSVNGNRNVKEISVTTRSVRRKSNSGGSNSSSSAEDSVTKVSINKKREDSGQLSNRGATEKQRPINVVQKETIIQKAGILVPSKTIRTLSPKQKVTTDREQRSRRRRASSHDETSSPHLVACTADAAGTISKKNVSVAGTLVGTIPLKNKRSVTIEGNSNKIHSKVDSATKGEYAFRNKKTKVSSGVKSKPRFQGKKEVLKVQLLTGTLYLSKSKVVWTFTR